MFQNIDLLRHPLFRKMLPLPTGDYDLLWLWLIKDGAPGTSAWHDGLAGMDSSLKDLQLEELFLVLAAIEADAASRLLGRYRKSRNGKAELLSEINGHLKSGQKALQVGTKGIYKNT